ncbi:MAG: PQQ-binding-like beta-propeller repeat protein, partial [Chloroflexi bacterium]|nr:PQQ-binding-like beta-propeller repeat protein [Chloroflexota bacterium]
SSDGRLYAVGACSGSLLWSYHVGELVWTSPAVVDGVVYFGSHDGYVYALER